MSSHSGFRRLDRAGHEYVAFSRYYLMVSIALNILKINVHRCAFINEG